MKGRLEGSCRTLVQRNILQDERDQAKDVFNELKMSEYYLTPTKMDRRKLTYVEKLQLLRMFYKD